MICYKGSFLEWTYIKLVISLIIFSKNTKETRQKHMERLTSYWQFAMLKTFKNNLVHFLNHIDIYTMNHSEADAFVSALEYSLEK